MALQHCRLKYNRAHRLWCWREESSCWVGRRSEVQKSWSCYTPYTDWVISINKCRGVGDFNPSSLSAQICMHLPINEWLARTSWIKKYDSIHCLKPMNPYKAKSLWCGYSSKKSVIVPIEKSNLLSRLSHPFFTGYTYFFSMVPNQNHSSLKSPKRSKHLKRAECFGMLIGSERSWFKGTLNHETAEEILDLAFGLTYFTMLSN